MSLTSLHKHDEETPFRALRLDRTLVTLAFALSIILHLIGFWLGSPALSRWLLTRSTSEDPIAKESLEKWQQRRNVFFNLVETPESARRTASPPNADHASDKNAASQNPTAPQNLPIDRSFSPGMLADAITTPSLPGLRSRGGEAPPQTGERATNNKKEETQGTPILSSKNSSTFRREYLTGGSNSTGQSPGTRFEAGLDQRTSRAPELGSFSLNTYAWNYAPYLLWLKKRIQSNIYPPPAFTHMGLISGQTRLRFRILRDGTLQGLELLEYNGHMSLMQTSMRAVEVSIPFKKLPEDFPEDYLEITAQFEYSVFRGNRP
ncbi:MAG: hypothetical protein ACREOO_25105 [bacterium]